MAPSSEVRYRKRLSTAMPERLEKSRDHVSVAASDFEARYAALERRGADLAFLHDRQAGHVGDPLEFGRALGRGDAAFPAERTGGQVHRQQLAAGGAGEQPAAAGDAAGEAADRQRRDRPLVDPLARAVGLDQAEDLAVQRPDDDDAFARWWAGRRLRSRPCRSTAACRWRRRPKLRPCRCRRPRCWARRRRPRRVCVRP